VLANISRLTGAISRKFRMGGSKFDR